MAVRQGLAGGRMFGAGSVDGVQRSDYRVTQSQLARLTRNLTGARYPMRIGAPDPKITSASPNVIPIAGGTTVVLTGDHFDSVTGDNISPQQIQPPPASTVVTDDQHITIVTSAAKAFGQVDIYVYNNASLGLAMAAQGTSRVYRMSPFEQYGATLFYRAPHFTIVGTAGTWFSSERGGPQTNYFPAACASGGPTAVSGCPVFTSSSSPLTNSDLAANWLGTGDFHIIAVVDLANITSTTHLHGMEGIVSDTNGVIQLGFYINAGTWRVSVGAFSSLGYEAGVNLPTNTAQRVVVQAKSTAGVLKIRLNGGSWITGNTIPGPLDTGGTLVVGKGLNAGTMFQGTIWALGIFNAAQPDVTYADLINTWAGVAFPTAITYWLDLDSRHVTTHGVSPVLVDSWQDQSGNGWDATVNLTPATSTYASLNPAHASYNGVPAVVFDNSAIELYDTTDTIASSINSDPVTLYLVGHVESVFNNPTNNYFLMTKSPSDFLGFLAQARAFWGPYGGSQAPFTTPYTNPSVPSILCAVMTGGDTSRFYCNSKNPKSFVTNAYDDYFTLALGSLTVHGETNQEVRLDGYTITKGFRVGQWQTPDTVYSPAGPILRVLVCKGAHSQAQVESVLATLEATYGILIQGEDTNTYGATGAWDAGPSFQYNFSDNNLNIGGNWTGKSTRGPSLGQDLLTNNLGGGAVANVQINSLNAASVVNRPYKQQPTESGWGEVGNRTTQEIFAKDGSAGTIIVAFHANSTTAASLGTVTAQTPDNNAGLIVQGSEYVGLYFTTSGLIAGLQDNVARDSGGGPASNNGKQMAGPVACSSGADHIAVMRWDGTNLWLAVDASGGVISWTSVLAGNIAFVADVLYMGQNGAGTKFVDMQVGAVRLYKKALTDPQINQEASFIQTLLGWSNGFTASTVYTRTPSESITLLTMSWTRVFTATRPIAEGVSPAPSDALTRSVPSTTRPIAEMGGLGPASDAATRTTVGTRAIAESKAAPTDALTRALVEVRAIADGLVGLSISDTVTRASPTSRAVAESIAVVTAAVTRALVQARAIAESITASSDAAARATVEARAIAESKAAPTDALVRATAPGRPIAESVAAPTDAAARLVAASRAVSESIVACLDTVSRASPGVRAVAETITACTDALARLLVNVRAIAESKAAPTDAATRASVETRAIAQSLTAASDALTRALVQTRAIAQSVSAPTDAGVRAVLNARNVAEAIAAATDTATRTSVEARAIADSISAALDAVARVAVQARAIAESKAAPTDALTRALANARAIAESEGAPTDAVSSTQVLTKLSSESIVGPDDALVRVLVQTRAVPESMTIVAAAIARSVAMTRSSAESIGIPSDAVATQRGGIRQISETAVALDSVVGVLINHRFISEAFGAPTDSIDAAEQRQPHFLFETTNTFVANGRQIHVTRNFADTAGAVDLVHRNGSALARALSEAFGAPTDALIKSHAAFRAPTGENVAAPTDGVTYLRPPNLRSVGDTTALSSATALRSAVLYRAVADSVGAPTDSPSRQRTFLKAVAESIAAPADAIVRTALGARLLAEMVGTPSDARIRLATHARAVGENVPAPFDALVRAGLFLGLLSEGVVAPADGTLTRAVHNARAIGEAITITDSVFSPHGVRRAQSESLLSPSDAISMLVVIWSTVHNAARVTYDLGPKTLIDFGDIGPKTVLQVGSPSPKTLIDITQGPKARITMSHLGTFDVGDVAEIAFAISTRLTGVLGDPAALSLTTLHKDTGAQEVITYDGNVAEHRIVKDAVGKYRALLPCTSDKVGDWIVQVNAVGGLDAMQPTSFTVRAPLIPPP